jgi:hypothetical protein
MINRVLKAVVLATLMASLVFSQTTTTPPSPPTIAQIVASQVAYLTTLLDLTSDQQTQATTISRRLRSQRQRAHDCRQQDHSQHS